MSHNKIVLTNIQVDALAQRLATAIDIMLKGEAVIHVYPVPRGGIPAAYALAATSHEHFVVCDRVEDADIIVDDIIDSGSTRERYSQEHDLPFVALIDKTDDNCQYQGNWVVFPWEVKENGQDEGIEENIRRILEYLEPQTYDREGLVETPARVAKAFETWFGGYKKDAKEILKVFEDGAEGCSEMVIVKDIPFYSHCEHHMAAIFGTVTVAYIPNKKIVGLSKINRLVDMFARRLQVQERLTNQIADTLATELQAEGVGVIVRGRHLCMESRGVKQQGHHTITSALRGVLKTEPEARAEFMSLAK